MRIVHILIKKSTSVNSEILVHLKNIESPVWRIGGFFFFFFFFFFLEDRWGWGYREEYKLEKTIYKILKCCAM
jgi:hypothetical protein